MVFRCVRSGAWVEISPFGVFVLLVFVGWLCLSVGLILAVALGNSTQFPRVVDKLHLAWS